MFAATGVGGRACVASHARDTTPVSRLRNDIAHGVGLGVPFVPWTHRHVGFGGASRRHASEGVLPRTIQDFPARRRARHAPSALPRINDVGSAARIDVMRAKPLFTIGMFADAQYADRDDQERPNEPGRTKFFRASPERLRQALRHFMSKEVRETMACIVNLGDLVDGVNDDDVTGPVPTRSKEIPKEMVEKNTNDLRVMTGVIHETVRNAVPVYHCLGNHDLNLSRRDALDVLYEKEKGNEGPAAYFSKKLPRNWRLLVLDTTELNPRFASVVGSKEQRELETYVLETNARREGVEMRDMPLKPWGGGIGGAQLLWLKDELRAAVESNERIVITSHVPLCRTGARPGMASWNCDEVSELLESCPAVMLCVAGHDHPGRYGRTLVTNDVAENDETGGSQRKGLMRRTFGRVHFVTLEAMLEAPKDGNAFAVLEFYDHEVIVNAGGEARGFFGKTYASGITRKPKPACGSSKRFEETETGENQDERFEFRRETTLLSSSLSWRNEARDRRKEKVRLKNHVTDRRLRVSPRGLFTGVASFGDRPLTDWETDSRTETRDETSGSETPVPGSIRSEMSLLDWINANRDDRDVNLR